MSISNSILFDVHIYTYACIIYYMHIYNIFFFVYTINILDIKNKNNDALNIQCLAL